MLSIKAGQLQITKWKRQLEEHAATVFGEDERAKEGCGPTIAELHAKTGELAMENDFCPLRSGA